jgi:hypothetical protein
MKLPFASLQHRLRLQSAYSQAQGAEPEITNSLGGERQFEGCLDYIWLSESLRATAVLPVPTVAEARLEGGARFTDGDRAPTPSLPESHLGFLGLQVLCLILGSPLITCRLVLAFPL